MSGQPHRFRCPSCSSFLTAAHVATGTTRGGRTIRMHLRDAEDGRVVCGPVQRYCETRATARWRRYTSRAKLGDETLERCWCCSKALPEDNQWGGYCGACVKVRGGPCCDRALEEASEH